MNFNLIIQFISFYILKILFNTFFKAGRNHAEFCSACWLVAHTLSHGSICFYFVIYHLMQRNKLSVTPCSVWVPMRNTHRNVIQAYGLYFHTTNTCLPLSRLFSWQFLFHWLSSTSIVKEKSNLCTDVGIFNHIYLVSFLQHFHSFILFIYFSQIPTPFS